ncbi:hypothetical protein EV363DRAFT_1403023 [Boletus edulis]|nr:hypothetical protein EV363DRAFT_1403023 [Boletus edulis]
MPSEQCGDIPPYIQPTLFKMAFELGATSTSLDFTDRVTHLIANSHSGAKYMRALEHKTLIVTPDWITEVHAIWLRADDVDVEQVRNKLIVFPVHIQPPAVHLFGCRTCWRSSPSLPYIITTLR